MEKVRYVGRPHEEIEVTEQEADDMRRRGLLVKESAPTSNRTPAGSGGKDKE